ncbi:MAG: hypothetical protein CMF46_05775 [Legionellales bacterium]|nr:hypothetical protein [Legionellales bacterium]
MLDYRYLIRSLAVKRRFYEILFLLFAILWASLSISGYATEEQYAEMFGLFGTFINAMSQVLVLAVLIKLLFESFSAAD